VLFNESHFPKLLSSITPDILHDPPTNACASDNWILSLLSMHTCSHNSNSASSNFDTSILPSIPPIPHPNATIPAQMPLPSSPTYIPNITPDITTIPNDFPLPHIAPDLTKPVVEALPPVPTSTHFMQTRAKSGIFKPKVCYIAQPNYLHTEPPSFKVAIQYPQ
jgi:hypothetical protein